MAKNVKKKDEDDNSSAGTNLPDGAKALSFIERIENLEAEKASHKGEYMQKCKAINESKDEVFDEAKTAGFRKKSLKAKLRERSLQRKLDDVAADLEGADSDNYAALSLALEKLGPLGEAALKAA